MAGGLVPRRGQHPPRRRAARLALRARIGDCARRSRAAARHARRDEALQPARARRRRVRHGGQMGELRATRPAPSATSSATPTKANRERSRIACCCSPMRNACSRGWRSPASWSARPWSPLSARRISLPTRAVRSQARSDAPRSRLLGASICGAQGFDFDIEIHLGAGAYICGEESALIEVARRQAGQTAHPSALPGDGRLSRQADRCGQRRDARRGD